MTSPHKPSPPKPNPLKPSSLERKLYITAAALLTVASLIVIGVAAYVAVDSLSIWRRPSHNTVVIAKDEPIKDTFILSSPQALDGTTKAFFSLSARQLREDYSLEEKVSYTDARNYLVFDYATNEGEWLWEGNDLVGLATKFLGQVPAGKDYSDLLIKTEYIAVTYVPEDSNEDGRLDTDDSLALMIYDLATGESKTVLEGVENIASVKQVSESRVLIVYTDGEKTFLLVYDLAEGAVKSTKVLKFQS